MTATSKATEMQTPQNMKLWNSETLAEPQKGPSRELVKHAVGGLAWQEAQARTRVRVAAMLLPTLLNS